MNEENINTTQRLGVNFHKRLEYIKNKRLDIEKDLTKKSTRALTNFMIRHKDWKNIENDLINFEGEIK